MYHRVIYKQLVYLLTEVQNELKREKKRVLVIGTKWKNRKVIGQVKLDAFLDNCRVSVRDPEKRPQGCKSCTGFV